MRRVINASPSAPGGASPVSAASPRHHDSTSSRSWEVAVRGPPPTPDGHLQRAQAVEPLPFAGRGTAPGDLGPPAGEAGRRRRIAEHAGKAGKAGSSAGHDGDERIDHVGGHRGDGGGAAGRGLQGDAGHVVPVGHPPVAARLGVDGAFGQDGEDHVVGHRVAGQVRAGACQRRLGIVGVVDLVVAHRPMVPEDPLPAVRLSRVSRSGFVLRPPSRDSCGVPVSGGRHRRRPLQRGGRAADKVRYRPPGGWRSTPGGTDG